MRNTMPLVGLEPLSLCSLPEDVMRRIIRVDEHGMESMRTISPLWNALVAKHKYQKERIRAIYPMVALVISEKRGQVKVEMRANSEDQAHFEQHGFCLVPASGPTTPLNSNANAQRGFVQLLFIFIHLLIVPFLPDTLAIVCPIILALCFGLFGNDGEIFRAQKPAMNIISKVDKLILKNLSEHSLRSVRELTRNERVNEVHFKVYDFNQEQRRNLLEIINNHSVKVVEIVSKKFEIVGLRSFLCDISTTVSVLHIEELRKGYNDSSTMFGQLWGFWGLIAANLLSCGMLSVTMTSGKTEKKYADPVFEFMSLFEGIKKGY